MSAMTELEGEMDNLVCDCLFDLKISDLENDDDDRESVIRLFQKESARVAVESFKKEAMAAINKALGVEV